MTIRLTIEERLDECANAIIRPETAGKIDLSDVDIMNLEVLDDLANRVEVLSDKQFTIRLADKRLFGGLEPMGPCKYMARLSFADAPTADYFVHTVDDDIVLLRLTQAHNGLRVPAPRRARLTVVKDSVETPPEEVTPQERWNRAQSNVRSVRRVLSGLIENHTFPTSLDKMMAFDSLESLRLVNVFIICEQLDISLEHLITLVAESND